MSKATLRQFYGAPKNRLLSKKNKTGQARRSALASKIKAHRSHPMTVLNSMKKNPKRYSTEQVASHRAAVSKKYGSQY